MALGDVIAKLAVSLTLNTAAFEEGADIAEKRIAQSSKNIAKFGEKMTKIGTVMSVGVTAPLMAFGVTAVKAAKESAEAMGQVDAALKSMGDKAGYTSEQLGKLASDQMRQSLYDDDDILRKVTANLLTFGNVSGEAFAKGQQAALDMSARLGTDLQGSAIMVGKALNDPIKGVTALQKVGVSFSATQKEQIVNFAKTGELGKAQAMILAELEKQYGGSAKAMREADPMAAAGQSWAEFQETIGQKILPLLPAISEALVKVIDAFASMSPAMQEAVVIGGAVAAALGPIIAVLGGLITVAAPLIAALKGIGVALGITRVALLALAMNPIILGLTALVTGIYLAWKNWDKIKPIVQAMVSGVTSWLQKLAAPFNWVVGKLSELGKAFFALYDKVVGHSYIPDMVSEIGIEMAKLEKKMVDPTVKATKKTAEAFRELQTEIHGLLNELFPEIGKRLELGKDIALIGKSNLTPAQKMEARRRLYLKNGALDDVTPLDGMGGIGKATEETEYALDKLVDKAEVTKVQVTKSFEDMAKSTMESFSKLASAIKGGGFLDILDAAIGLGLQLAGAGLFGKKIQTRVTKPQGYATGTKSAYSGLKLVGERGPELVNFKGGERVMNNRETNAFGSGGGRLEIVPSKYFDVVVDGRIIASSPAIMAGGAQVAGARLARAQSRRLTR